MDLGGREAQRGRTGGAGRLPSWGAQPRAPRNAGGKNSSNETPPDGIETFFFPLGTNLSARTVSRLISKAG